MKHMIKWLFLAFLALFPFSAYADRFDDVAARCAPLRGEIEAILNEEGVSTDYYYLALAESGCKPSARSSAGAVGLWQLTAPTARAHGLTVNARRDDRLDWRASTRAAARYIRGLQERFESFYWTIAAYNVGGANLAKITGFKRGCGLRVGVLKDLAPSAFALTQTVKAWKKRGEEL